MGAIRPYEGEGALTKDNRLLGVFTLTGIPPAPRGVPNFKVTFEIEENGVLKVVAKDRETGNKNSITIASDKGGLSNHIAYLAQELAGRSG
uniref:Uncharacterized protein n=1 Tax=Aegilops tauschii TaxID=37682 RepID=N1QQP3_AEGTA